MTKAVKLTEGSIFKAIIKLALPIIGTSFVQMAYNLTDMIWVGRVGAKAVCCRHCRLFYMVSHGNHTYSQNRSRGWSIPICRKKEYS